MNKIYWMNTQVAALAKAWPANVSIASRHAKRQI